MHHKRNIKTIDKNEIDLFQIFKHIGAFFDGQIVIISAKQNNMATDLLDKKHEAGKQLCLYI